ncbi:carboxymuconolactone decarboxylase family protein [Granulicella sibirica]|uniref:Carboxymuconolactone decarboxylase-like domain-containing protein n=1 Tax=Granulicella sibirica TaxID=2479048 RepID=A0A4Q0SU91_9BACT|nr:peroxidase-related enzyme [Granulicella sibirica]RXH54603.1 hypothetical protein GRAN_3707 [Granulicella sibirica]
MTTPEYELLNQQAHTPRIHAANLPIVREDSAPPEVAPLYARFRSHFNRPTVPGILQCFATHPPLLEHMMGLAEAMLFSDGALGRQQKELIATFISSINECAYCADSHGFFLRTHGASDELLRAALTCDHQSSSLSPRQQALLTFAKKVNDNSAALVPTDIEDLRGQCYSDLQIAEVIHLTALFATFNRVVNAFGLSSQDLLLPKSPEEA